MTEIRYTSKHQWIRIDDDGQARVGITRFAAGELGVITFIELPEKGVLSQDDSLCVVESTKAASDVFMPVDGRVAEVNERLEMCPTLLNESPEGEAWICRIEDFNRSQFDALMTAADYEAFLQSLRKEA